MFGPLFDALPDAFLLVDQQGVIVRANPRAERLFGYSPAELVGICVDTLVPEPVREQHQRLRTLFSAAPDARPMNQRGQLLTALKRDGSTFPVEIALSPLRTDQGLHVLASIRDVTETYRVRRELVRARYDSVVARIGHWVVATPSQLDVLKQLPRELAQALELDAVELILIQNAQGDFETVGSHGLTTPLSLSATWQSGASETLGEVIVSGRTLISNDIDSPAGGAGQPGAGAFRSLALMPIFDAAKKSTGALLAFSRSQARFDHDRLHCLQSVAILLSSHIQRQRTELKLIHAQKLEALGQLTGGIAHDVNNLLTVISGNLQLLELHCPPESAEHVYIRDALRSVANGAKLTRKLLAFSSRQHLSPQRISPRQLLLDFGDMLRRTLGERIKIEVSCAADVPDVMVDAGQLETALLNLALNARDAMPHRGQLTISARQIDGARSDAFPPARDDPRVEFSVTDTGDGMTPDVLAHAMEPFFTTKDGSKGNGLGLSMVYGFVLQSGGEMTIKSRPGYGTTVKMHFPAARTDSASPPTLPALATARPEGARVLVVEDDPAVRATAVQMLHSLGYETTAVADVAAALDAVLSMPDIALVFSDVALGNSSNGIELGLAARAARPTLPILLTSGYEYPAIGTNKPASLPFELLRKPYRIEELDAAIRRLMQSR